MDIIFKNIVFFSFVQIAIATARYRHYNKQDPGRNIKLAFIALGKYNLLLNPSKYYITDDN